MNFYTNTWWEICQKHDYVRTTGKDLVINIPSRNNPHGLIKTLRMMYNKCVSQDNFDIFIVIDYDQIDLYKDIKEELYLNDGIKNIIWSHPKHQKDDWWNIFTTRHNFLKSNDYYFEGLWTDDFAGLNKKWDENICDKKHWFTDDYFSLHTNRHNAKGDNAHGRQTKIFDSCYVDETGGSIPPSHLIWNKSECLPVTTRKLSLLLYEIMKPHYMTAMTEMLVASVVMLLYKEHGHKRLIDGGYSFTEIKDSGTSTSIGCGTTGKFRDKKEFFDYWTDYQDYKIIRPIVEKIANTIIDNKE